VAAGSGRFVALIRHRRWARQSWPPVNCDGPGTRHQAIDLQRALAVLYAIRHALTRSSLIVPDTTVGLDEPDNFLALREIQPWLYSVLEEALCVRLFRVSSGLHVLHAVNPITSPASQSARPPPGCPRWRSAASLPWTGPAPSGPGSRGRWAALASGGGSEQHI